MALRAPTGPAKRLLDFIAAKEAPLGYDTVYNNRAMPQPLTSMTLDQVIADGPRRTRQYGSSACGRYQFMTATLKHLKAKQRLDGATRFAAPFQDALGFQLLLDCGFDAFMAGRTSVTRFGLAIAQEWASFPVLQDMQGQKRAVRRGQSYYAGDGLNKSLVSADEVQTFLTRLRSARDTQDTLSIAAAGPLINNSVIAAPTVEAVPAPTRAQAKADLPIWARWFARKPKVVDTRDRPGLKPGGDPALYDAQVELRARSYYTKIKPDGLLGPITTAAVAAAQRDNGLPETGVIDDAFLNKLPTMKNRLVPANVADATAVQAIKDRPDLFRAPTWLASLGLGSVGLGGADTAGLFDKVQEVTGRVNDVTGSVQSAFGTVTSIVEFAVAHRSWIFVLFGLWVFVKAANMIVDQIIRYKQLLA